MKPPFFMTKIAEDIFCITEPYYTEHANMFLVFDAFSPLLIDCGIGVENIYEFLKSQGFSRVRVFLTHPHFDHIGGTRYFSKTSVFAPPLTVKHLDTKKFWGLEYFQVEDFKTTWQLHARKTLDGFSSFSFSATPFTDSSISVGQYSFRIFATPGHTDDSTVLYDARRGLLITGDTLYNGIPYYAFPNSNITAFVKSLAFLSTLKPSLVLPGHNEFLDTHSAERVAKQWIGKLEKEV